MVPSCYNRSSSRVRGSADAAAKQGHGHHDRIGLLVALEVRVSHARTRSEDAVCKYDVGTAVKAPADFPAIRGPIFYLGLGVRKDLVQPVKTFAALSLLLDSCSYQRNGTWCDAEVLGRQRGVHHRRRRRPAGVPDLHRLTTQ